MKTQDPVKKEAPAPGWAPFADPKWEAFARHRARGLSAAAADREAGFKRSRGAAGGLARRPEVKARVAFLIEENRLAQAAALGPMIGRLLDVADAADCATPSGLREARLARLEARRLYVRLLKERMGV